MEIIKFGEKSDKVNPVLRMLKDLGYYKGELDGVFGRGCEQALRDFQQVKLVNGRLDEQTYHLLIDLHNEFIARKTQVIPDLIIKDYPLNLKENEYIAQKIEKTQIILHLTAGWANAYFTIQGWENDQWQALATAFVIAGEDGQNALGWKCQDGEIFRAFSEDYWAYHTGASQALDMRSIGIEICNWAYVFPKNGKFYSYANAEVPTAKVEKLSFRGFDYWEKISDKQIESVKKLLLMLCFKYPKVAEGVKKQTFDASWSNFNPAVIDGLPGIWTHTSVVPESKKLRWDMPPFPSILKMLNEVKNEI